MTGETGSILELSWVEISDICGLWEVIRISNDEDQTVLYPWIKDRFKYNFLPEMIFLCIKDGENFHGTWNLSRKTLENQNRCSIILNGTFEFIIIDINEDELILSDSSKKYSLIRRL